MAAGRIIVGPYFPARDQDNFLMPGARLYVYDNGTTDKSTIYSDSGLSVLSPNPVIANSSGQFPPVWAEAGTSDVPVPYTVQVTADDGESPGNPFTFDNFYPSLDWANSAITLAEAAATAAEGFANDAEQSAIASEVSAVASAAALAEILDIAENAPEAPSIANKANLNGSNVTGANATAFRTAIGAASSVALAAETGSSLIGFLQNGSDAVARTVANKLQDIVSVQDFGAVGDGTTNDLVAIQRAYVAALARGARLVFPGTTAGYAIGSTLTIAQSLDVEFQGGAFLRYTGSADEPCLQIGNGIQDFTSKDLRGLRVFRATQGDWTQPLHVGIRFAGVRFCNIEIIEAGRFTIGVECAGDTRAFAYNALTFGNLYNNQYALMLTAENGSFCNENLFINGNYGLTTGVGAGKPAWGVSMRTRTGGTTLDANVWLKPCMQVGNGVTTEAIAFQFSDARECSIIDARDEGNDVFIRALDTARNISYSTTYTSAGGAEGAPVVQCLGKYGAAAVGTPLNKVTVRQTSSCWVSRAATDAWQYASSTTVFPNMDTIRADGTLLSADTNFVWKPTYVSIPSSRGVVRGLNTLNVKQFTVRRECVSTYGGRLYFSVFDANGALLTHPTTNRANSTAYTTGDKRRVNSTWTGTYLECTTSGTSASSAPTFTYNAGDTITDGTVVWTVRSAYVRAESVSNFNYSTDYGGAFGQTGADSNDSLTVTFGDDVKTAYVILAGGSPNNCRLSGSVSIEALAGETCSTFRPTGASDTTRFATAVPADFGVYPSGQLIGRVPAASAQPIGWFCGNNAISAYACSVAWVTATAYSVDDIRYNGSNVYVVATAGTSGGTGPVGTTKGVVETDGSVGWLYLGPRATFVTGPSNP